MPSLKDFIFSALGGKKDTRKPIDFGFKDSTNVDSYAPKDLEEYPDQATMRRIWLGTKTEPPSGTHISSIAGTPQWNNSDKASGWDSVGFDSFKNSSARDQQAWKDAYARIKEEYPYADKNLDELNYDPEEANKIGAAGYVNVNSPRKINLNRARRADDPYQTLMHEMVHTNQMGAFPDPKQFRESYNPEMKAIPFRRFRVIEAPAYKTAGQDEKASDVYKNYLKQRMKP